MFADYNGKNFVCAIANSVVQTLVSLVSRIEVIYKEKIMENMKTSQKCKEFIQTYEGFAVNTKDNGDGSYTVGYGYTVWNPDELKKYESQPISEQEALDYFNSVVIYCEDTIKRYAKERNLFLTQSQFDAYVSYGYNVGPGYVKDVMDLINNGADVYEAFFYRMGWQDDGNKKGLNRRWFDAAQMYQLGDYAITPLT